MLLCWIRRLPQVRLNHGYVKSVQNSRKFTLAKYSKSKYDQFSAIKLFAPCIKRNQSQKTGIDTEFQAVDCRFQSLSLERGFWIPIVSGIPDSLIFRIPKPRNLDSTSKIFPGSGFHSWKFPRFRNPESLTVGATLFFFFNECRPWQADWIPPECTVMRRLHLGMRDQMLTSRPWTDRILSAQMVLSWPDSDLWGKETMPQPEFAIFSVAASLFCKGAAQTCHQSTAAVN